jgi:hypothetical protein
MDLLISKFEIHAPVTPCWVNSPPDWSLLAVALTSHYYPSMCGGPALSLSSPSLSVSPTIHFLPAPFPQLPTTCSLLRRGADRDGADNLPTSCRLVISGGGCLPRRAAAAEARQPRRGGCLSSASGGAEAHVARRSGSPGESRRGGQATVPGQLRRGGSRPGGQRDPNLSLFFC